MKVCVVGSGGREHALAHVLGRYHDVVVTPGNPGIPGSVATSPEEVEADLFVIGPEAPLVDGLADRLRAAGRLVFGPGADGARLEGSKAWMKNVLVDAGVPTAAHGTFTDEVEALAFLDTMGDLFVVKTDGLASGKGVMVTTDRAEAIDAVRAYLSGEAFGDAGRTLVIEEGLTGPELSVLAVCDGTDAVALAPAQDFKRRGDANAGPNTGGMGAYSPVPVATDDVVDHLMDGAVRPTLAALRARGIDYRGVLYCGLMLTPTGPRVLEYNVRFGDPECQPLLMRLQSDLVDLIEATLDGQLDQVEPPQWDPQASVCVVMASEGYPGSYEKGHVIEGIDEADAMDKVKVFHAGTTLQEGQVVNHGGRVLGVTALGETVAAAQEHAYKAIEKIHWQGAWYRSDIADKAIRTPAR